MPLKDFFSLIKNRFSKNIKILCADYGEQHVPKIPTIFTKQRYDILKNVSSHTAEKWGGREEKSSP